MQIECLICNKKYHSLAHHLSLVHKMNKDTYISLYNLPKDFNFVSSEYNTKMSNTIKNKFWTDDRKQQASIRIKDLWKTDKYRNKVLSSRDNSSLKLWRNPSYRAKILKYRHTQFSTTIEYNNTLYRSRHEVKVAKLLDKLNIKYTYEDLTIPYYDENNILRTHITDFYIKDYNLIIEVKSETRYIKKKELLKQQSAIALGYKYIFIDSRLSDSEITDLITGSLHSNV